MIGLPGLVIVSWACDEQNRRTFIIVGRLQVVHTCRAAGTLIYHRPTNHCERPAPAEDALHSVALWSQTICCRYTAVSESAIFPMINECNLNSYEYVQECRKVNREKKDNKRGSQLTTSIRCRRPTTRVVLSQGNRAMPNDSLLVVSDSERSRTFSNRPAA